MISQVSKMSFVSYFGIAVKWQRQSGPLLLL